MDTSLQEDLIPHASTLILYTASAQTHIFPEIRIDAVRFLTLFLKYIPEPILDGWMDKYELQLRKAHLGRLSWEFECGNEVREFGR